MADVDTSAANPVDQATAGMPSAAAAILGGDAAQVTPEQAASQFPYPAPPQPMDVAQPESTTTIAPQQMPPLPAETQQHMGWLHAVLDKVGTALGGGETWTVKKDADGNVSATQVPATAGEKWGRIAQAALTGAAAGFANSQGPGGLGKAAAAGVQAGSQLPEQNREQVQAEATQQQKDTFAKASNAAIHQRMFQQMLESKKYELDLTKEESDLLNTQADEYKNDPNAKDYGPINGLDDLTRIANVDQDFLKHHANLQLKATPVPDGKGHWQLHAVATDPGEDNQPVTGEDQAHIVKYDPETGRPTLTYTTAAKGQKKGPLRLANQAMDLQFMTSMNAYNKAHPAAKPPANQFEGIYQEELGKTPDDPTGAASRTNARVQKIHDTMTPYQQKELGVRQDELNLRRQQILDQKQQETGNPQQDAAMMVDGLAAPSQFSKRAKEYNAMLPYANTYSMQKYGVPFDAEVSEARFRTREAVIKNYADGKQADQIQSFNTFLGHAQDLSNSIAKLRNTDSPVLNMPYNKLRTAKGDPAVTAILPDIEAVRTEYQNFLNNNHALHDQDIEEGKEILDENASPAQMEAAMKAFAKTALIRTGSLNDRYYRTMGTDVPGLLNQDSQQALQYYGLGAEAQRRLFAHPAAVNPMQPQQQRPAPQQQQDPRVPVGKFAHRTNGAVDGYADDQKGTNYVPLK